MNISNNSLSNPLVSVIAVSYNHQQYILETLESIANQTCKNIELIYCDDLSTDRTVEIAQKWLATTSLPYQTIIHTTNQGLCNTLNEARQLCRGEYVQYVSCDDRLLPDKFERQLHAFASAPETVGVVCSEAKLIDGAGKPRSPYLFTAHHAVPDNRSRITLYEQLLRGAPCIAAPSALVKKSVLDDIGPYDPEIPYEDYDMWLRILRKYEFVILDEPTVDYRIHSNNLHLQLHESGKFDCIRCHIIRKHLDYPLARELYRRDLCRLVWNNKLCSVTMEDLIACEFDLQEVADKIQRMKYSPFYILGTWSRNFAIKIAKRLGW